MKKRLDKLRKVLELSKLDAILLSKYENYVYFSGFNGSYAYLLITKDSEFLFTDFRYVEQALLQAPNYELIKVNNNFIEMLNDKISSLDINTVGFESLVTTYNSYTEISETLKNIKLVPLKDEIDYIRSIKDKDEITKIEKAIEIADLTFSHILDYIRPNVSEKDIALEMEYFMKKNGASSVSFETIVASGFRGSMPHGIASDKLIESGDTIVLDFGAIYEGYCSDMTRTVFLGNPKDEMLKIYNIVLNAQNEAIQNIKEGLTGIEVDLHARRIIINEGYEDNFGHGLGHGVGLEIHESPRLSPSGKNILHKNMTVTIEPGIYISGVGGVRIEDVILIGEKKSKVLTKSSKEIIIL
jgi:Xaa-Pro aminopeptidase